MVQHEFDRRMEAVARRAHAMDTRRQTQIARQSARISALTEFLEEQGLLDAFTEWDREKHGI